MGGRLHEQAPFSLPIIMYTCEGLNANSFHNKCCISTYLCMC